MKYLLLPLSWLYALVIEARNKTFDWGIVRSESVDVPVISVGNITTGGTGKTPLVEYIVKHFQNKGKNVAVIARGYKRSSRGVVIVSDGSRVLVDANTGGDEPVQIAHKFPKAVVVVGERRVEAARVTIDRFAPDLIILDDGFQHRHLRRDLNIVVMSASKDIVGESLLPSGSKREGLKALRRADVVALSRADSSTSAGEWSNKLHPWFRGPIVMFQYVTETFCRPIHQLPVSASAIAMKPVLAFSGIGDHKGFVRSLESSGFNVRDDIRFPDHHSYTFDDMKRITSNMKVAKAEICVTTEKDSMRLLANDEIREKVLNALPVYYPRLTVEIFHNADVLNTMLDRVLEGKAS